MNCCSSSFILTLTCRIDDSKEKGIIVDTPITSFDYLPTGLEFMKTARGIKLNMCSNCGQLQGTAWPIAGEDLEHGLSGSCSKDTSSDEEVNNEQSDVEELIIDKPKEYIDVVVYDANKSLYKEKHHGFIIHAGENNVCTVIGIENSFGEIVNVPDDKLNIVEKMGLSINNRF